MDEFDPINSTQKNSFYHYVNAAFPSHEHDGKFSTLAKKIWVEQLDNVQFLLAKDYFYTNEDPDIRASHGLIFFKEMNVEEFLLHARELEKSMEGIS